MNPTQDNRIDPGLPQVHWHCAPYTQLPASLWAQAVQLRHDVFVIEQQCDYQDLDGLDPSCRHLLAVDLDDGMVACARILPAGLAFAEPGIGRVVVARHWRGRGLGQALMRRAVAAVRQVHPGQPIRISAQAHLLDYYGQFGFEGEGMLYDDAGIPHQDMVLPSEQIE